MPDADQTIEVTTDADAVETDTTSTDPVEATEAPDKDSGAETFPRKVVEDLRRENAGYRDRAKTAEARADELARALFAARVSATGKLADATDLTFDAEALDDPGKLSAAIDALTASKPHLKARKLSGSVGQGVSGDTTPTFSLLDTLRGTG